MSEVLRRTSYARTAAGLFVILIVLAALRGPDLFTADGIKIAFAVAAPLVLATMALTPIAISGRGAVDLSIGPMIAFVNVTIINWLILHGVTNVFVVVGFALLSGMLLSTAQGLIISIVRLQPVVVTLGGYLIFSGLADLIQPSPAKAQVPGWLSDLTGTWFGVPAAAVVLAVTLLIWVPIGRSTFFRNVRMLGFTERTAYASGLPVIRTRVGAYMLGGLIAGVAALMVTSLLSSADPNEGAGYTLTAITALVLGGTAISGGAGGMTGSVIAALDVYLIQYVLATFQFGKTAAFVNELSNGAVLLLALGIGALAMWLAQTRRRTA